MVIPLIILPSPFLIDDKVIPPLGILYIATSLKCNGFNPLVIDLNGIPNYIEYLLNILYNYQFDFIGISLNYSQIYICENIIQEIRKHFTNIKIIGGGPGITSIFLSKNYIRKQLIYNKINELFDVCVIGDGEKAILDIVSNKNVNRIIYGIKHTKYYMNNEDINKFPLIDRNLINILSYSGNFGIKNFIPDKSTSIITQRGCPYNCNFCCSLISSYRLVDINITIMEIEQLYLCYGFTNFIIRDDEFNINIDRLTKFVSGMELLKNKYNINFNFKCFCVAKIIPIELRRRLYQIGLKTVLLGAESGDDKILKSMNKVFSVDDNTRFIESMNINDIDVKCTFSLGHPGESDETLYNTDKWIMMNNISNMNFTVLTQYPLSNYYDNSILINNNWKYIDKITSTCLYNKNDNIYYDKFYFLGNPIKDINCNIFTDYLSSEDIINWKIYFDNKYHYTENEILVNTLKLNNGKLF